MPRVRSWGSRVEFRQGYMGDWGDETLLIELFSVLVVLVVAT